VAPRTLLTVLVLVAAAALGGCGGESEPAKGPPGIPDNPLVSRAESDGTDPDAPGQSQPGFKDLVENQSRNPDKRLSPCALVTKKQAQAILGARLVDPVEAPQGPTCIYRDREGKNFITLAVMNGEFGALRDDIRRLKRVSVADRRAYCGVQGQPMLYLPLGRSGVLSVTAQCDVAMDFARKAVPRLGS
jgi:hypothetical protein